MPNTSDLNEARGLSAIRPLLWNPEIKLYLKNSETYQSSKRVGRIALLASVVLDIIGVIAIIYAVTSGFSILFGIAAFIVSAALMPVWIKAAKTRFAELRKAQQVLGVSNEQLRESYIRK